MFASGTGSSCSNRFGIVQGIPHQSAPQTGEQQHRGYCRTRVSTGASRCSPADVYTATMENLPTLAEWFDATERAGRRLSTLMAQESRAPMIRLTLLVLV
jgi:hypothetical protein